MSYVLLALVNNDAYNKSRGDNYAMWDSTGTPTNSRSGTTDSRDAPTPSMCGVTLCSMLHLVPHISD